MGDEFLEGFHGHFDAARVDVQVAALQPAEPIGCNDLNFVVQGEPLIFCGWVTDHEFTVFIGADLGVGRDAVV